MICKHLQQFSMPETVWRIESCAVNDRPYNPNITELNNFCKGEQNKGCPVLLRRESAFEGSGLLLASCTAV
ncbi:MAG: hypothetical protein HY035_05380 [Nitrospirae bacterium]|nr:hypothetical protein [Nitrospirota bacterium]